MALSLEKARSGIAASFKTKVTGARLSVTYFSSVVISLLGANWEPGELHERPGFCNSIVVSMMRGAEWTKAVRVGELYL